MDIEVEVNYDVIDQMLETKNTRAQPHSMILSSIKDEPSYDWNILQTEEPKQEKYQVNWDKIKSTAIPGEAKKVSEAQESWYNWSRYQTPGDVDTIEETIERNYDDPYSNASTPAYNAEDWDSTEYFDTNWSPSKWASFEKDVIGDGSKQTMVPINKTSETSGRTIDLTKPSDVMEETFSNTEILLNDLGLADDRIVKLTEHLSAHHQHMMRSLQEIQKYNANNIAALHKYTNFRFNEMQVQMNVLEDLLRQSLAKK